MKKLSSGQDSTLGNYRRISAVLFGEHDPATKYLDEKIAESPHGEREEVIADEGQMLYLLASMRNTGNVTAAPGSDTPHFDSDSW